MTPLTNNKENTTHRKANPKISPANPKNTGKNGFYSNEISIRTRLILFILITCLSIISIIAAGLLGLGDFRNDSKTIITQHLIPTNNIAQIKALLADNVLQIQSIKASPTLQNIEISSQAIDRNSEKLNSIWKSLKDSLTTSTELDIALRVEENVKSAQISTQNWLDTLKNRLEEKHTESNDKYKLQQQVRIFDKSLELILKDLTSSIKESYDSLNLLTEYFIEDAKKHSGKDDLEYKNLLMVFISIGLLGLAVIIVLSFYIVSRITKSLSQIISVVDALEHGDLDKKQLPIPADEFGNLSESINNLTVSLRRVADFATEIGEGNFEQEFEPLGINDQLGVALTSMRDKLQTVAEEERLRNWAIAGYAKFSEMLQMSDSLEVLPERLISNLTKYIDANQGAFFLVNDENPQELSVEMVASYAYNKRSLSNRSFRFGEGFVGQAAAEREIIYITDVPGDYVTMTSGLGEATPKSLLITPLNYNNVLQGVIEFASFSYFQKHEIEFIKKISENIAATFSMLRASKKTLRLLTESQKLSNELQEKQTEIMESNQKMQVAQQELLVAHQELDGQIRALNNAAIVSETDKNGVITFVNDSFIQISRYSRRELIGSKHSILRSTYQSAEFYEDMWSKISSGNIWRGILKNRTKNGTYYWVEACITPVLDIEGNISKFISVQIDITTQKNQEEKLSEALEVSMAQEEELRQNAEELETSAEEMRRTQIELTGQITVINQAAIVSETDTTGRITFVNDYFLATYKYFKDELIGQNHRILKSGHQNDDIFSDLWQTVTKGRVWKGELKNKTKDGGFVWVNITIAPVLGNDQRPIKFIAVSFDITQQRLHEEQIKSALEISRAQETELRRNATEMAETQNEMRKTQVELRGQIGALNNAAIVSETDLKGTIIMVNEEFCRVSQHAREELIGENSRILKSGKHPEDFFADMWKTISKGRVWKDIIINKAKDGSLYYVNTTITPVLNFEGKPVKYISVSFDISAQKEQELQITEALEVAQMQEDILRENADYMQQQQQQLLKSQIELAGQIGALNNSGLVYEMDLDGTITFVNEATISLWGFSRQELIGKNYQIIKSEYHPEEFYQEMFDTIKQGSVWQDEVCGKNKAGVEFWILLTITPVLNEKQQPTKYISVSFDITRQKQQSIRIKQILKESQSQEEKLRSYSVNLEKVQQEMLKAQVELAGQIEAINRAAIVSELSLDGLIIYVNKETCQIWGYSSEELIGKTHDILRTNEHPPEFYEEMNQIIHSGEVWQGEVKYRSKDGTEFWVRQTITPVKNQDNEITKFIVISFDITRQKLQSQRIKEALNLVKQEEKEYQAQIEELKLRVSLNSKNAEEANQKISLLENSFAILEYDLNGKILFANQQFLTATDYSFDELTQKTIWDLLLPEEIPISNLAFIWEALQLDQTIQTEYVRIDKTGQVKRFYGLRYPVTDPQEHGNIVKFMEIGLVLNQFSISAEKTTGNYALYPATPQYPGELRFDFSTSGEITYISPFLSAILPADVSHCIGKSFISLFKPTDFNAIVSTLNSGEAWSGDLEVSIVDGYFWARVSIYPILNEESELIQFIGQMTDVTNLMEINHLLNQALEDASINEESFKGSIDSLILIMNDLRKSHEKSDKIFAGMVRSNLVLEVNMRNQISFLNDSLLDILNFHKTELIGKPCSFIKSEGGGFGQAVSNVRSLGIWKGWGVVYDKYGKQLMLSIVGTLLDNDYVLFTCQDLGLPAN